MMGIPDIQGTLYNPSYERDSCGVGFVADVTGHRAHKILQMANECVCNVTHRGAVSSDAKTGDGAGITTQIPYKLMQREIAKLNQRAPEGKDIAVGMAFLPGKNPAAAKKAMEFTEAAVKEQGVHVFGWRQVPTDRSALGKLALDTEPNTQQLLMGRPQGMSDAAFGRALYLARRVAEKRAVELGIKDLYFPSFSDKTIVYKGLLVAPQLSVYYKDLVDKDFETALAVYHQRYSTNTFPNWYLAQPFRYLSHNGEINTLQGNTNWIHAREPELSSKVWDDKLKELYPIIWQDGSDSAMLDNAAELVHQSGRDILHTMLMLVPEAWENMPHMNQIWKEFYEYHATITEPWDGPAALAFIDGVVAGACLDRNGLRPARYKITDNDLVVMGSEVGVVDLDDAHIIEKGRLGPGEMIAVDTAQKKILRNTEIKNKYSTAQRYGEWVRKNVYRLGHVEPKGLVESQNGHSMEMFQRQRVFGYTLEDMSFVIKAMVLDGKEPVFSMGDDTSISILAVKPRLLYSYFKQRFAQVTNPPIDPLREELVMSLNIYLGPRRSLLEETPEHAQLIHLSSPLLSNDEMYALKQVKAFKSAMIPTLFPVAEGAAGLERSLNALCVAAEQAIDGGAAFVILSDHGVDPAHAPIPMLLAVGALHQHLIHAGKRMKASIVVESAEPRDVHHFAALLGYGASAINPYLGFDIITEMIDAGEIPDMDAKAATKNYRKALELGILKIMSKMGISTVTGYHGAQIFEAIGVSSELIDRYFTGTTSPIGGITLKEIADDIAVRHKHAFEPTTSKKLDDHGYYRYRKDGEDHMNSPMMVKLMHTAVTSGKFEDFKAFSKFLDSREPMAIRDLLEFKQGTPIPLDQVESVESIVSRFISSAMSLGALSPEAHTTLSKAMNLIGGKSNTGEGGDDPVRYWPTKNGESARSAIKQVASGRFGVTAEYLASADELEIKMAQGSKPGEGGQLPGHKVVEHIARLRHAVPGIQLISPPPHHDIYSIEDLAQLIYDLKQANPRARVSVKLVSESGVGTIAAGVAKGYADNILISGDSGGTGASPLSSIKNAGVPWEIGLAETQQVLVLNDLRGRVKLKTDGGLRTGREVVIAAMLGAEEFGFGTGALIAIGCKMARQCHLNTCPVGVATQKEELRKKFFGTPEMAANYFRFVAMEVRELLAALGYRSLQEVVGRTDLLHQKSVKNARANLVNLSKLLADPDPTKTKPRHCAEKRNDRPGDMPMNDQILRDSRAAIEGKGPVKLAYAIKNTDRTVGATLAGELAYRFHTSSLPNLAAEITFKGSAGQSFGAFAIGGLRLILEGEANDYVGKGMAGGEIIIRPSPKASFAPQHSIIMGNTVLYGATGGFLFASGRAGERFGVRNSGATAVIEGAGDHCCEYMTAGLVVVLGETGKNFGAGMTNGSAYILDEANEFPDRYNPELIIHNRVTDIEDKNVLHSLIQWHVEYTNSPKGKEILVNWERYLDKFWKVTPLSQKTKKEMAEAPGAGPSPAPAKA